MCAGGVGGAEFTCRLINMVNCRGVCSHINESHLATLDNVLCDSCCSHFITMFSMWLSRTYS